MNLTTVSLPALALLAAAFVPSADAPRFAPAEGSKLQKTFTVTTHLKSDSIRATFGDESMEDDGEVVIDDKTSIVVSDEYKKLGKGRPLVLVRTYEEVEAKSTQVYKGDEDGDEQTKEQKTDLAGKKVEFAWDEGESAYTPKFADDEGDSELLEDLEEDMDFRAFLPPADSKEGATWTVKGKAVRVLMFPGGDLKLVNTEDEEGEDNRQMDRALFKNAEGRVDATLGSVREEDGVKVAVIKLEGELETKGETNGEQGKVEIELTGKVTGEILWNLAANHVHSAHVSLDQSVQYTSSIEIEIEGQSHSIKQELELSGTTVLGLETSK